jgi:hypothetical protein
MGSMPGSLHAESTLSAPVRGAKDPRSPTLSVRFAEDSTMSDGVDSGAGDVDGDDEKDSDDGGDGDSYVMRRRRFPRGLFTGSSRSRLADALPRSDGPRLKRGGWGDSSGASLATTASAASSAPSLIAGFAVGKGGLRERLRKDGPDAAPPSKWWMPIVASLITRVPDKKSKPRFEINDKVMFRSSERAAGAAFVEGRVVMSKLYMAARRGAFSTYHYEVTWTDYTLMGDKPDHLLSAEAFEKLRKVSGTVVCTVFLMLCLQLSASCCLPATVSTLALVRSRAWGARRRCGVCCAGAHSRRDGGGGRHGARRRVPHPPVVPRDLPVREGLPFRAGAALGGLCSSVTTSRPPHAVRAEDTAAVARRRSEVRSVSLPLPRSLLYVVWRFMVWRWLVLRLDFYDLYWEKKKQDKIAAEIAARAARKERNRAAKSAGASTVDGFNFFFTVAELNEWMAMQTRKLERLFRSCEVSHCACTGVCVTAFVRACVCARVCLCVRACVRACERASVRACMGRSRRLPCAISALISLSLRCAGVCSHTSPTRSAARSSTGTNSSTCTKT